MQFKSVQQTVYKPGVSCNFSLHNEFEISVSKHNYSQTSWWDCFPKRKKNIINLRLLNYIASVNV